MSLPLKEQVVRAIEKVDAMFYDGNKPPVPEGETLQSLWDEILKLRGLIKTPKKVAAVKMLLEDDELSDIPIAVLSDILQTVYKRHGVKCETSENSIRWYISQNTMIWDIKRRTRETTRLPDKIE